MISIVNGIRISFLGFGKVKKFDNQVVVIEDGAVRSFFNRFSYKNIIINILPARFLIIITTTTIGHIRIWKRISRSRSGLRLRVRSRSCATQYGCGTGLRFAGSIETLVARLHREHVAAVIIVRCVLVH